MARPHRATRPALAAPMAWLVLALLLAATGVQASPTADEYKQCHREAAARLQYCLDEGPGYRHGTGCWLRSRTTQQRCYKEVRASHQRPAARPARGNTPAAPSASATATAPAPTASVPALPAAGPR